MCVEGGECFDARNDADLLTVIVYPYCEGTDCHMYAVVIDAVDGSKQLFGDKGSSYDSLTMVDTDSSLKPMGAGSPYLKPVAIGCNGCPNVKSLTCAGPIA